MIGLEVLCIKAIVFPLPLVVQSLTLSTSDYATLLATLIPLQDWSQGTPHPQVDWVHFGNYCTLVVRSLNLSTLDPAALLATMIAVHKLT